MAGKKRWQVEAQSHGTQVVNIRSWKFYTDYVDAELVDFPQFIFRGQASADWPLEPTLDRVLRTRGRVESRRARAEHLEKFKFAVRGRRGPSPPHIQSENDWWALGQHQGLHTPLLDWTISPYVGAYFAFESLEPTGDSKRAIYAIDMAAFRERSAEIERASSAGARPHVVEFVRPMSDENARLVSQRGLFTRAPDGTDLAQWVRQVFPRDYEFIVSIKITLPSADRVMALQALNRMNINRLSLFPDLSGASDFCNFDLQIDNY